MPRLTEQLGLLVLQLDPCYFVLLQLAPFISYSISIIVHWTSASWYSEFSYDFQ